MDKCETDMNESVQIISTLFSRWANLDNDVNYIESDYDTDILLAFIKVKDAMVPVAEEPDIHPMLNWVANLIEGLPSLGELSGLLIEKYLSHHSRND